MSDLIKRIDEHKREAIDGFTKKYNIHTLVYYEMSEGIRGAIEREKQLKKWKREWKIKLREEENPDWKDLFREITDDVDTGSSPV